MLEPGLTDRLAGIEEGLRALQAELEEVRRLVAATEVPSGERVEELSVEQLGLVARAWRELERGREREALGFAAEALARALREGDERLRREVAAFAAEAASVVEPFLMAQALELAGRAAAIPRAALTPEAAPSVSEAAAQAGAPGPAEEPAPALAPAAIASEAMGIETTNVLPTQEPPVGTAESAAEPGAAGLVGSRGARFELSDARLFAFVGGVVTLLGVVFLFVLAANRGKTGSPATFRSMVMSTTRTQPRIRTSPGSRSYSSTAACRNSNANSPVFRPNRSSDPIGERRGADRAPPTTTTARPAERQLARRGRPRRTSLKESTETLLARNSCSPCSAKTAGLAGRKWLPGSA